MNIVLSVYSRNAYKEFVLPAVVNTRTTLVVRRDVFGLAENLNLNLENEDGIWFFAQDNNPVWWTRRIGNDTNCGMVTTSSIKVTDKRWSIW